MNNNNLVSGFCSGTYVLAFTDLNGCSSNLINGGVSQQTVNADNTTVADINTSNITSVICNGSSTGELEVSSPNLTPGYTYSWQDINGNEVSSTTTASNLSEGIYVLYADYNSTDGCTATDTATVTGFPAINPSVLIDHVDCYGDATGMLQASVAGNIFDYITLWNPGSILAAGISGLQQGTYTLTITDTNSCSEMHTFEVTQPQLLLPTITQNGYILEVGTVGGVSPYSYSWREQSSPTTDIGLGSNYLVTNDGIYYVLVTDANGCVSQSNKITYSPLSVSDIGFDLNVYPNPFREEAVVDFGQRINTALIRIVDVYGKLVETHKLVDTDKYILKRAEKARGVYFMEIEINTQYLYNIKLVIQ